jgi:hypothetical protein
MRSLIPFTRTRSVAALAGLAILATTALLSACGGGGGSASTGTLNLSITDAPSCGYDHVYVTVSKVSVNQSSTASATDPGWQDLVLSTPQQIDLNTLTNGVLAQLGQLPLAPGKYTQMRLQLVANSSSNPLANSVVPTGSVTAFAMDTPSAQ